MKVLKRILLFLAVIIVLVIVIGFFLPSKTHVERSMMMKGSVQNAYDQVNTLKNWEGWSPWDKIDPNMKLTYSGPASGKDAKYEWTSDNSKVGNGALTITESMPDSAVNTIMDFKDHGTATSYFKFAKVNDSVKVTWGMNSDMGMNPIKHYFGMMMNKMIGSEFDEGLKNMKNIVEKMPATAGASYPVEETKAEGMHAVTMNFKCTPAEIGKNCMVAYPKLQAYITKSGLKPTGHAFAIYNSFSAQAVDMSPGIPVDKPAKSDGDIMASEMMGSNVLKVSYTGPYSGLGNVHMAINQYAKDHNKQLAGAPWEVYMNDPMTEKDSTKYITEVYYPVK